MHRPNVNRREKGDSPRGQRGTVPFFPATWLVLLAAAAVAGCHSGPECGSCNDITPGAIPQPNGTYACQWVNAEKARADQDEFVIYRYEWSADALKLTPSGQEHIAQIARALCQVPCPVVIEPSADRGMDESRRAVILDALVRSGSPVNPDRVILARPEAEGLYGDEAPGIARGMLSNQTSGQGGMGGSTTGTGGLGGGQGSIGSSAGIGVGVGMGTY
ncbi:MAG: hypothetical protein ACLQLG_20070 [Thermoguttaceae bacterium]